MAALGSSMPLPYPKPSHQALVDDAQGAQALQRQEAGGHAGQQHVAARHQRAQLRQPHAVHLYELLQVARARRAVRLRADCDVELQAGFRVLRPG